MVERSRQREYVELSHTTKRWDRFEHRAGDVFVCTPPKVGTTWTQGIVRSLIHGSEEPPGTITIDAPWLDFRIRPIDEVIGVLDAQTHRRCIKTHTSADGIPFWEDSFYISVYRPGRDAFMSWVNHITSMRFESMVHMMEEAVADGVELREPVGDDVHDIFQRWIEEPPQLVHFQTFWPLRAEPNVRILHYNDLLADLPGEMRRLGEWLGIEIDEAAWPRMVERCTIDEMRAANETDANISEHFQGGATTFFHKGSNDRWKGVLTDDELAAYDRVLQEYLDETQREWHEAGSLAVGWRPEDRP